MTRKKILMACANYWNSPFQVGSHHIARAFVKSGWDVAFVSDPISPAHFLEGISMELLERFNIYKVGGICDLAGHLWTYVPGAFLTPHNKPILRTEWVARNWSRLTLPNVVRHIRDAGFGEVDLLYFDSLNQSFWLNVIKHKKSLFRIADKNSDFNKSTPAITKIEFELARTVDLVIYTAESLKNYVQSMQPKSMMHISNGVNFDHFAKGSKSVPPEYKNIKKPIAVYVGAMDIWFDFDLINYAADALPQISFVLIGPDGLAKTKLKKLPNIYRLGRKSYSLLPKYLYNADVGLIPFDVMRYPELVHSVNPLKLYEYMACGLPVVAVEWDELKNLKSPARLCKTKEEFAKGISDEIMLAEDKNVFLKFAANGDWTIRVQPLLTI